jgi:predicted DNA-binding WGR domain protein
MHHPNESIDPIDSKHLLDASSPICDSAQMISQPYHLYIERTEPTLNMARYYQISIEPTLFGGVSLSRSWGRIGCHGQSIVHLFDDERPAVTLFLELAAKKRKRGYRPRATPNLRPQPPKEALPFPRPI